MKVGIIFSALNSEKTVEKCLSSWQEIRANPPTDYNFVFSCVSARFKGYENFNIPADKTVELVRATKIMDFHLVPEEFLSEIEARGQCLDFLKQEGVDIIWVVDIDEIYTVEQILNILEYVKNNKQFGWFKLCLKNYVFDEKTFLSKSFTPPRIYRMNFPPFKLGNFFEDNGISWVYNENQISHVIVPNKCVPKNIAFIKHFSWNDPIFARQKIDYQRNRGWTCDFTYDENGKISFNPAAFKDGKFPEVLTEN